jgi:hypothetical protein
MLSFPTEYRYEAVVAAQVSQSASKDSPVKDSMSDKNAGVLIVTL